MFLINQTTGMTEIMKIHIFRKNLRPYLASEIRYKKPATLTDACNLAIEYEDSFGRSKRKTDYSEVNNTFHKSNKFCSYCHKKGHLIDVCFKLHPENKSKRQNMYNHRNNDKYKSTFNFI